MAGISRDQTAAAVMTPAAKPRKIRWAIAVACLRKKNTTAAPKVVIKNVKPVPPAAHSNVFMDSPHPRQNSAVFLSIMRAGAPGYPCFMPVVSLH